MRITSLLVAGFAAGVAITASGCDSSTTTQATRTPLPSAQTEQPTQPTHASEPGGGVPETTAVPATKPLSQTRLLPPKRFHRNA
ncbi:hypothetical protein ACIBCN_06430 [Nocardia sp. NPDC051052]|uniref:hypothetical protein n=1 Tax=Nocardia sp. NPDC051052 TaxID=3364322 RepID=UPI0037B4B50E